MGQLSKIEWTDITWNPVTGCSKVSQGCKNCYAERLAPKVFAGQTMPIDRDIGRKLTRCGKCGKERWVGIGPCGSCGTMPTLRWREFTDVQCHPERLEQPLHWRKPRRVFVNSMSDLFHADVPDDFIDRVFAVMAVCPQHTFQILTKRPERIARYFNTPDRRRTIALSLNKLTNSEFEHANRNSSGISSRVLWGENPDRQPGNAKWLMVNLKDWPLPNVWLGVSVENQETADERIPLLLQTLSAVRFLSCEPLLSEIHLNSVDGGGGYRFNPLLIGPPFGNAEVKERIDWVIVGGESGPGARPMHPDWIRLIRDQCQSAGVPFFFKQWGEWIGGKFDRAKSKMICEPTIADKPIGQIFWTNPGSPKVHLWDMFDHYWTNASARVGKKSAGRMLDGRLWDEFPKGS